MKKLLSALVACSSLVIAGLALGAVHGSSYKVAATLGPKGEVPAPEAPCGREGDVRSGTYEENSKERVLS